jgi:beta-glucanase (GH16 family)
MNRPAGPPRYRRGFGRRRSVVAVALVLSAAIGSVVTAVLLRPAPMGEWRQVFKEDFSRSVPLGQFPGATYGSSFTTYPDGWADTLGKGRYQPSEVLSVADGVLTFDMHTVNGTPYGAAVIPSMPTYGQTYGKFELRFRADPVPGFGLAFLLWPDSEKWPRDGEIDFPEGDLGGEIMAFAHHATQTGAVDTFHTGTDFSQWHIATIEWRPSTVTFLLDGNIIGVSTQQVPTRSMHWVLQTGTTTGAVPAPKERARIQVDWMEAFAYQ